MSKTLNFKLNITLVKHNHHHDFVQQLLCSKIKDIKFNHDKIGAKTSKHNHSHKLILIKYSFEIRQKVSKTNIC
jgi:hypothetical protein